MLGPLVTEVHVGICVAEAGLALVGYVWTVAANSSNYSRVTPAAQAGLIPHRDT